MSSNNASITAVLGSSGSGKSTYVKRTISRGHARLFVWDAMGEYGNIGTVYESLHSALVAMQKKRFKVIFVPSSNEALRVEQFDLACRAALAAGNMTLVIEELRFVTTPSRAPLGWARVCMTGRHAGLTVIGTSQRPANVDKDFLGNCTRIRTGRLAYPEDVATVAKTIGRDLAAEITGLMPLDWIEKDMTTQEITRGRLTF